MANALKGIYQKKKWTTTCGTKLKTINTTPPKPS